MKAKKADHFLSVVAANSAITSNQIKKEKSFVFVNSLPFYSSTHLVSLSYFTQTAIFLTLFVSDCTRGYPLFIIKSSNIELSMSRLQICHLVKSGFKPSRLLNME